MVNYEELEARMDRVVVLTKTDLSMEMSMDMITGLARSFGIKEREAITIFNDRVNAIDKEASSVMFDIVEK